MNLIKRDAFTWGEFLSTDAHIEGYQGMVLEGQPGRYVPFDLLRRDMGLSTFSKGGALVGEHVEPEVIPFLRSKSICARLGAQVVTGLRPPTGFPVVTGDFSAQFSDEFYQTQPSQVTLGQQGLTPRRLSCVVIASKFLEKNSGVDFDAFITEQASAKIFQTLDTAALTGTGGNLPIGILNAQGTSTVTFGGAATWPKILNFEQDLGNANADGPRMGWAQSPNTRAKWKAAQRASGTSTFLQADDNTVAGYPSSMTMALSTDQCIFGNWSDLILGVFFNGFWVTNNPYTLSDEGQSRWAFHLFCDVTMRHPASFCVSTDSAAQ
jgi:HK97 family phage major capsid protein